LPDGGFGDSGTDFRGQLVVFILFQRHLEDLGEVQGLAVGALGDLFAATEAVGDDQAVGGSTADGGEEFEFTDGHGNVVFVALEAERAGHTAASGGGLAEVDAETAQD